MENTFGIYNRAKLIEMGIIIESEEVDPDTAVDPSEFSDDQESEEFDSFANVDYDLQNEIIRFFANNPGAEPELVREYAASIGVEPDELQRQMNILFSQLLKLYLQDAENLGYGSALVDDEVPEEIQQMVSSSPEE